MNSVRIRVERLEVGIVPNVVTKRGWWVWAKEEAQPEPKEPRLFTSRRELNKFLDEWLGAPVDSLGRRR